MMISGKTNIKYPNGLHARPASQLVSLAKSFSSKIVLRNNQKEANAVSIIGLLALGLKSGSEVDIIVDGHDETDAFEAILGFFETPMD